MPADTRYMSQSSAQEFIAEGYENNSFMSLSK